MNTNHAPPRREPASGIAATTEQPRSRASQPWSRVLANARLCVLKRDLIRCVVHDSLIESPPALGGRGSLNAVNEDLQVEIARGAATNYRE